MSSIQTQNPLQITLETLINHPHFEGIKNDPNAFANDTSGLESPVWIPDTQKAVEYLKDSISNSRPILVIGDRDVDGVCSTALLGNFLKSTLSEPSLQLELIVSDDGDDYGLSGKIFERALQGNHHLIVLLDMGSSNGPEIKALVDMGKKVIVLDHHQLHERVPDPQICAFVNPVRLEDCEQFLHKAKISTSGIVFKVLLAYALSFTSEWSKIYQIEDEQKGITHFFQLGLYLGSTKAELSKMQEKWKLQPQDTEYVKWSSYDDAIENAWSQSEWTNLLTDPQKFANLFVSKAIQSRKKLNAFVMQISRLASFGLMSDIVPLVGENRTIVKMGFTRTEASESKDLDKINTGINALLDTINLSPGNIKSKDAGWTIGPVLNAAGRMGNTQLALDLLTQQDQNKASILAQQLCALNQERKKRTQSNEDIVKSFFKNNPAKLQHPIVFCYHPDLQKGVSGIVATRLSEKYQKPAIYINPENDKMAKGSARTWNGVNVLHLIDHCSDLFEQFGGHPEAAGFSILIHKIPELESRLIKASSQGFDFQVNNTSNDYHVRVPNETLGSDLYSQLLYLEPFGCANPEPRLLLEDVVPDRIKEMSNGLHLKFSARQISRSIDFVIWQKGQLFLQALQKHGSLDLIGSLEINHYAGKSRLQFRIESFAVNLNS